jgi:hypothetical protein
MTWRLKTHAKSANEALVIPGLTLFVIPDLIRNVIATEAPLVTASEAPLSLRAKRSNLIPANMSLLRRTSSQ